MSSFFSFKENMEKGWWKGSVDLPKASAMEMVLDLKDQD